MLFTIININLDPELDKLLTLLTKVVKEVYLFQKIIQAADENNNYIYNLLYNLLNTLFNTYLTKLQKKLMKYKDHCMSIIQSGNRIKKMKLTLQYDKKNY